MGRNNKPTNNNNSNNNGTSSDRLASLDMAIKQIEKQFGKGSVMKLGEKTDTKVSSIPSGSLALDSALGIGGYPRGRIIEVYGN